MTTIQRFIRVLVYEGTPARIAESIEKRGVKGSRVMQDLTIREAVLGDFLETIESVEMEPLEEK